MFKVSLVHNVSKTQFYSMLSRTRDVVQVEECLLGMNRALVWSPTPHKLGVGAYAIIHSTLEMQAD